MQGKYLEPKRMAFNDDYGMKCDKKVDYCHYYYYYTASVCIHRLKSENYLLQQNKQLPLD